ncbi:unnamed protein product [Musa textilis]
MVESHVVTPLGWGGGTAHHPRAPVVASLDGRWHCLVLPIPGNSKWFKFWLQVWAPNLNHFEAYKYPTHSEFKGCLELKKKEETLLKVCQIFPLSLKSVLVQERGKNACKGYLLSPSKGEVL